MRCPHNMLKSGSTTPCPSLDTRLPGHAAALGAMHLPQRGAEGEHFVHVAGVDIGLPRHADEAGVACAMSTGCSGQQWAFPVTADCMYRHAQACPAWQRCSFRLGPSTAKQARRTGLTQCGCKLLARTHRPSVPPCPLQQWAAGASCRRSWRHTGCTGHAAWVDGQRGLGFGKGECALPEPVTDQG